MGWQEGTKVRTFEDLAEVAKNVCNNVVTTGTWDAVDPKDARVIALSTQLEELYKSTSPKHVPVPPTYETPAWRKKKGKTTIEKDNHTWHWFKYHQQVKD